jgi:hypothetical protein
MFSRGRPATYPALDLRASLIKAPNAITHYSPLERMQQHHLRADHGPVPRNGVGNVEQSRPHLGRIGAKGREVDHARPGADRRGRSLPALWVR